MKVSWKRQLLLKNDENIIKITLWLSKKKMFYLLQWKPFKNDENCFLFHPTKALFLFKIFEFLYLLFDHVEKSGLIRKTKLTSKFMMSQPGYKIITIHIFTNISRSWNNETMKFAQLIEYNKRNIFL